MTTTRAPITREQVAELARLARIEVTEAELESFATQLDGILEAVAHVQDAVGDDLPAGAEVAAPTNVWRADVVEPSLGAQAALAGAPSVEDGRFRVPRILDEE